jgi:Cys-rich four helix bundle protein (predicted Tat secretion target)
MPDQHMRDFPLSRRDALGFSAAGILAAAAGATAAVAGDDKMEDHSEHAHHHGGGAKHATLISSALTCIQRGEVCAEHCIALLGGGDTSLKDCLRSVQTMLPMCQTLVRLGALDAKRLKEFAKVCSDVCSDCEQECKKHADKHALCKACMESCVECVKECKKVIES